MMIIAMIALLYVFNDTSPFPRVFKGKVIDESNSPIPDCVVSDQWVFYPSRPVCRTVNRAAVTDSSGRFELQFQNHSTPRCFLMLNLQREKGHLLLIPGPLSDQDPVEIALSDLVEIRGRVESPLQKPFDPCDIGTMIGVQNHGTVGNVHLDSKGRFAFPLPHGEYLLGGSGELFLPFVKSLVVKPGADSMELDPIKLQLTTMGKLLNKRAPDWKITAASPTAFGAKPSDLRGQWVLIDFWPAPSFLGGPKSALPFSYSGRLRSLIDFESEYRDKSDEFTIIVFYLADLKGFSDANNNAKKSIIDTWPTPRLPFVCALDQTLETAKAWGIDRNHMSVLLAPDGRVHPCSSQLTLFELSRQLTSSSAMDGEQ